MIEFLDAGAFRPNIDWEKHEVRSGRDPHTTLVLAKMTGIVEFIAAMRSIPARPVNVKTARVGFIGSGNLKGPEAKRRVRQMCKLLGWSASNNDESDALAVWHRACVVVDPNLAAVITPSMMGKAATTVGGADLSEIFAHEQLRANRLIVNRGRR